MSFNEILEELLKLTEDEKRQLWNILDQQLADEGEESPEFLAELDARIRAYRWDGVVQIRNCPYLNNVVEQDHRRVKSRVSPMLGFKGFFNARRVLAGVMLSLYHHFPDFGLSRHRKKAGLIQEELASVSLGV